MNKVKYDVVILGGGISGLVAAFKQQKSGKRVLLLEGSDRLGGVIQTVEKEGFRLEQGPNSILANEEIQVLIKELGIENKVRKNEAIASIRYLLFKDKPLKMTPSWSLIRSGFLNLSIIWAFITEPFRKKGLSNDESIANFIRRRLNKDILNQMINPLVTGVYAGDPEKLSLRSTFKKLYTMEQEHGSLIKAALNRNKKAPKREALSFEGGLNTLVASIGKKLEEVRVGTSILQVSQSSEGYEITYQQSNISTKIQSEIVISTLPTTATTNVFEFLDTSLKQEIREVDYAPMLLVYLGYPKQNVQQELNGFGYLIPQQEKQPYLGSIWSSAIFPEVAKEGHHLFTLFVGGVNNKGVIENQEESIIKAKKAFEKHMGITGESSFQSHFLYKRAIPQFNLGYYKLMEKMNAVEQQYPGLYFSGNWRSGVAIGDCVAYNFK